MPWCLLWLVLVGVFPGLESGEMSPSFASLLELGYSIYDQGIFSGTRYRTECRPWESRQMAIYPEPLGLPNHIFDPMRRETFVVLELCIPQATPN